MAKERTRASPVGACQMQLTAALATSGADHGVLLMLGPDGMKLSTEMSVRVARLMPTLLRALARDIEEVAARDYPQESGS